MAEVVHLDPPLVHQGLETKIDTAKTDSQLFSKNALTDFGRLMQTTQDFKLDFLLETR